ncbi:DUF4279 domain-containing protein [Thiobacillus sp.]|uniref:DUF4279 domain-containing protein n=1 Tax=Thiobacillus sp. TaxID=924 RepID=UPI0025DC8D19|nr:DUF4279 domain-containing protein [Thiobacillus sp.]
MLGCAPTKAWLKGHVEVSMSGRDFVKKAGGWLLHASDTEPENLDGQVSELLTKLTSDLRIWSALAQRFQVDLFCGWFMEGSNEGVSISTATMRALGERGIELSLDIYGPDSKSELESVSAQPGAQDDGLAAGGQAA